MPHDRMRCGRDQVIFPRTRVWFSVSALVVVSTGLASLPSCAESDATNSESDASSDVTLGPAPTVDASDAEGGADAGCDAADESCAPGVGCDVAPWCPVPADVSAFTALTAVWGSGKNDVWAVGSNGAVLHWDGASWVTTPTKRTNTFNAVWGSGANDVWIASATDTIFHAGGFTGASTAWTHVPTPIEEGADAPVFTMWGASADGVRIGGWPFHVFDEEVGAVIVANTLVKKVTDDGGLELRGIPGEPMLLGSWSASADDIWLVADNSLFVDWQRSYSLHGTKAPGSAAMTWAEVDTRAAVTLRAVWGSKPNDVWAVGDIGTIRHVTNASADEWQVVPSPTHQRLNAIWGAASNDVWAVGDQGTILHYDGNTWSKTLAAFPRGRSRTCAASGAARTTTSGSWEAAWCSITPAACWSMREVRREARCSNRRHVCRDACRSSGHRLRNDRRRRGDESRERRRLVAGARGWSSARRRRGRRWRGCRRRAARVLGRRLLPYRIAEKPDASCGLGRRQGRGLGGQ
ncbi:hypothetical protein AKJ09_10641 [Labilithrix luteola]|uniref:Type IV fimbrial biogenesis protein PilY1 n=1 Tax=Labilithrix luteola TaxID=1391654 RepID=A0A0K1QE29_9BACT|nr:hypothetical protein AKJ09_10641 [Labilithrix luteola]